MKKINVTIDKKSKITLETEGFKGEVCVAEIKKILSAFTDDSDFENKADYYESEENQELSGKIKLWVLLLD